QTVVASAVADDPDCILTHCDAGRCEVEAVRALPPVSGGDVRELGLAELAPVHEPCAGRVRGPDRPRGPAAALGGCGPGDRRRPENMVRLGVDLGDRAVALVVDPDVVCGRGDYDGMRSDVDDGTDLLRGGVDPGEGVRAGVERGTVEESRRDDDGADSDRESDRAGPCE